MPTPVATRRSRTPHHGERRNRGPQPDRTPVPLDVGAGSFWRGALAVAWKHPTRTFELLFDGVRCQTGWNSVRRGFVPHRLVLHEDLTRFLDAWHADAHRERAFLALTLGGHRQDLPVLFTPFGPGGAGRGWSFEVGPRALARARAEVDAQRLQRDLPPGTGVAVRRRL